MADEGSCAGCLPCVEVGAGRWRMKRVRSGVSPGRDPAVEDELLTSSRFRTAGSLEALFWARAEIIWIKSQLMQKCNHIPNGADEPSLLRSWLDLDSS